jgi:transketolase
LTLVASGGVVAEVTAAADLLAKDGIECRVLSLHTLKPFDRESLHAAAVETGGILTVEENTILGGLGGAVAEACLEFSDRPQRFQRIGINDTYVSVVGEQSYLRTQVGLDRVSIARTASALIAS